jgi:transcriptional regulatory protein RtcR
MAKRTIVLGLLGTQLDAGRSTDRWLKWRPTVSACQHDDLLIDRFELLYPISHKTLARTTGEDIAAVSPETEVRLQQIEF